MPEPDTLQLLFAAASAAPFAFGSAFAVRDGREFLMGGVFLLLAAGIAAVVCFVTGSSVVAVLAALVPVAFLSHARFLGAYRASPQRGGGNGGEYPYAAAAETETAGMDTLPEDDTPDALHLGMAFVGDMLENADRIGELRHKRRMRQLERQRAERELAAMPVSPPPPHRPIRSPQRVRRVRARRPPIQLLPPK